MALWPIYTNLGQSAIYDQTTANRQDNFLFFTWFSRETIIIAFNIFNTMALTVTSRPSQIHISYQKEDFASLLISFP